ncbi:MAG: NAD-dependent epimerase/dehydratase family protein [Planctomycetota bacterium]
MATILITGGAGFIGSHTADRLLAEGHRVRILDCLDPQIHGGTGEFPAYLHPAVEKIRGDVRNPADLNIALDGVDAVYHFAALTGVGQSMYDMKSYVDVNGTGTATLIEAIIKRRQKLKRFVLASSRAVYGEGSGACPAHGLVHPAPRRRLDLEAGRFGALCPVCQAEVRSVPTPEDRPLSPISVYAWTKKQQEEYVRYAAETFGLPGTILRYFNVYGSRQSLKNPYTGVVSIFYSRMKAHQPIALYEEGLPGRDFVHVSDVARANALALSAEVPPGTILNIGSGIESTIQDVAEALAEAGNQKALLISTGEFRVGDIRSCHADISRARNLLEYEPKVSLKQGMAEFASWAGTEESVDLYQKTVDELDRHGLFGRAMRRVS